MHEVWVPTAFHRRTFAESGVRPSKLHVVPEPVDVEAFNPARHAPLPLPLGARVLGPAWPHDDAGAGGSGAAGPLPFVFLSIFKWEARKVRAGVLPWRQACKRGGQELGGEGLRWARFSLCPA